MESKKIILIIILIGLLISIGLFYWYKIKSSESYPHSEIYYYCHKRAIKEAQETYKKENPEKKEDVERGIYSRENYNIYYGQCLIEKGI